jgi:hypothetical protein
MGVSEVLIKPPKKKCRKQITSKEKTFLRWPKKNQAPSSRRERKTHKDRVKKVGLHYTPTIRLNVNTKTNEAIDSSTKDIAPPTAYPYMKQRLLGFLAINPFIEKSFTPRFPQQRPSHFENFRLTK